MLKTHNNNSIKRQWRDNLNVVLCHSNTPACISITANQHAYQILQQVANNRYGHYRLKRGYVRASLLSSFNLFLRNPASIVSCQLPHTNLVKVPPTRSGSENNACGATGYARRTLLACRHAAIGAVGLLSSLSAGVARRKCNAQTFRLSNGIC